MTRRVSFAGANLAGRDLTGMSYRGVSFRAANLERANLRETDCREADFRGANLRRADLTGADLRNADFRGADLAAASLVAVTSAGARFEGAELRGAKQYKTVAEMQQAPIVPRLRTELPFITGTGLAFTSDGRYLAIAGPSFGIALWDTIAEEPVRHFNGHRGTTLSVAITPDDAYLVSGSADETVRLWSMTSDDVHVFRGHTDSVLSVAVARRRPLLVSGSADQTVRVWSIATRETVAELQTPRDVIAVAIVERPLRVIAILDGGQVYTWTRHQGTPAILRAVRDAASGAISPSGRYVAHGTDGRGRAIVRRVADGAVVLRTPPHVDLVNVVAFTPDSRYLLASSADGEPRLWPIGRPGEPKSIGVQASFVGGAAFGPDGMVATAEGFGGVNVRQDGRVISTLRGYGSEVFAVHLSDDGKKLVTGSADGHVHVFALGPEPDLRHALLPHGERRLEAVAMTTDGELIATGGSDRAVVLLDGKTGRQVATARAPVADVSGLAFAGRSLLIVGDEAGLITIYRVPDLEFVRQLRGASRQGVVTVAVSREGDLIAAIGWSRSVSVFATATGRRLARFRSTHRPCAIAFHPDGRQLTAGEQGGELVTYDVRSGRRRIEPRVHATSVPAVVFAKTGLRVSSDREGIVAVANRNSSQESHPLMQCPGEVKGLAINADGALIATGCEDGFVRISLLAGKPVVPIRANEVGRHFVGQSVNSLARRIVALI